MKFFHFLILIMVFLFTSSCSSTTVQLNKCREQIKFAEIYKEESDLIENYSFEEISTKHSTLFLHRIVELSKLLDENKRKCSELKKVELEIEENFGLFNKIILRF